MPEIIALSGYARTGKDTVGQILVERHGFQRVAFADALRAALLEINPRVSVPGFSDATNVRQVVETFGGWEGLKPHAPEVRDLLQRVGVAMRHACGADVWVRAALERITERTVITDCRFPNEADAVKHRGGSVWRIVRPGVGPANAHISETALDGYAFDRLLANDGSLDDLALEVRLVLGKVSAA